MPTSSAKSISTPFASCQRRRPRLVRQRKAVIWYPKWYAVELTWASGGQKVGEVHGQWVRKWHNFRNISGHILVCQEPGLKAPSVMTFSCELALESSKGISGVPLMKDWHHQGFLARFIDGTPPCWYPGSPYPHTPKCGCPSSLPGQHKGTRLRETVESKGWRHWNLTSLNAWDIQERKLWDWVRGTWIN